MKGATFMATPTNTAYVEDFVLPTEASSSSPTTFKLGVLDTLLRVYIDDAHTKVERLADMLDGAPIVRQQMTDAELHHKYLDMVRYGLRGWTNFKDANGIDVPFETAMVDVPRVGKRLAVTDACLARLDILDAMMIGLRIRDLNTVSREQRKN